MELSTLLVKAAFGQTLSDRLEEMRSQVRETRARAYMNAIEWSQSPLVTNVRPVPLASTGPFQQEVGIYLQRQT